MKFCIPHSNNIFPRVTLHMPTLIDSFFFQVIIMYLFTLLPDATNPEGKKICCSNIMVKATFIAIPISSTVKPELSVINDQLKIY